MGHNGCFDFNYLYLPNVLEFQFVDLSILGEEEAEFLSYIIYEAEPIAHLSTTVG